MDRLKELSRYKRGEVYNFVDVREKGDMYRMKWRRKEMWSKSISPHKDDYGIFWISARYNRLLKLLNKLFNQAVRYL